MISIAWPAAGTLIRSSGNDEELSMLIGPKSDWYPDKYPHPNPDVKELGTYVEAVQSTAIGSLEIHDLTVQEAFSALHGLGLPDERDCGACSVGEVFFSQKVTGVDLEQLRGSNRCVVRSITFDDGTVLSLGSAAEGAVIYRKHNKRKHVEGLND